MVEVIVTDEFEAWYASLDEGDTDAVQRSVSLLEAKGVSLPFPYSSGVTSKYPMRELRVQSGGEPIRIFYIFDAARQAVLLIGGTKKGADRFYEQYIPRAERIWEQYKAEQKAGRK